MNIFIVIVYRYGDVEKHSYPVGVFSSLDKANKSKHDEETYRGEKYECKIYETNINENIPYQS
jgi:hypothetical protein